MMHRTKVNLVHQPLQAAQTLLVQTKTVWRMTALDLTQMTATQQLHPVKPSLRQLKKPKVQVPSKAGDLHLMS